jgi:transcriptional regulator GlxA family with amidase domain
LSAYPAAVRRAIDLARRGFAQPIGVDELAEAAGLSRCHFTGVFTAAVGQSPGAFLRRERLRAAARLLQTTDLPLRTIADRCGFAGPSHLGRAFRAAHGQTPGRFRAVRDRLPRLPGD